MATATTLLLVLGSAVVTTSAAGTDPAPDEKIDPDLAQTLDAKPNADFWVVFGAEADLSDAPAIKDWAERGTAVVDALQKTAEASQAGTRAKLAAEKVDFDSFFIANAIYVHDGSDALAQSLAGRAEVAQIEPARSYTIPQPAKGQTERTINAIEWGIAAINADDVWSTFGVRGEGIVVANIDTGAQFDHPALVQTYRGNTGGGTFNHNYNWFDPARVCGNPSLVPCDNNGHGSHTMGTMVGDDGGANQVGVAPRARWIAAKGCETNNCSDASLLSSGQWILAPTDLTNANPRPDLRPHIVNNSWGGPGNDFWYQATVNAWRASGIFPAFSNGNAGPNCDTAGSPGDYIASYASGSFDINGVISNTSSRGPGENNEIKPNLAAPGVNVRSSVPGSGYAAFSGTSMASPHTAGTVALMWSAAPSLVGDLGTTATLLDDSAVDVDNVTCGGTADDNDVFGEGKLNAFTSVESSPRGPVGTLVGTVTDASTGNPIAGARVDADGPNTRDTTTDAAGQYRFVVPVGDYTVTASSFGYASASGTATVTEGATTTLDFALTPIPRHTVSGVVEDAGGEPLANATVRVLNTPLPAATTGADGSYSIADVPEGSYQVRADAGACNDSLTQSLTVDGDETLDFALPDRRDTFGHTCRIEATGYVEGDTPLALTGDDVAATVDLPFDVFFYGQTYRQAHVSTNGHVNFTARITAFSNTAIPTTATPNNAVYPFWDDLVIDSSSRVMTKTSGTAPNREFVIEWRNATFFLATTMRLDVEVVLSEGGDIAFHYRNLDPAQPRETGNSATVGIENAAGTDAFQYSLNTSVLSDSRSIRFTPPPSGRVVGTVTDFNDGLPIAGATVRALQGSTAVATTTTAADGTYAIRLLLGTYTIEVSKQHYVTSTAAVTLATAGEDVIHDVALHTPRAEVSPTSLSFYAQEGQLGTALLTLRSTSELNLTFTVTSSAPWLWTVPASGSVAPGTSRVLTVRVDPAGLEPGAVYQGIITLTTNAGRTPTIEVPVTLVVPGYRVGVNAGGGAFTDAAGDAWVADQAWSPGGFGYVGVGFTNTSNRPIAGTSDDVLFQTSREATSGYRVDALPAGTYDVELDFAELERNLAPGKRIFDVSINGVLVLPNYDIVARVGTLTADIQRFQVSVPEGGAIDIQFGAKRKSRPPVVNAVRVSHRPDL